MKGPKGVVRKSLTGTLMWPICGSTNKGTAGPCAESFQENRLVLAGLTLGPTN